MISLALKAPPTDSCQQEDFWQLKISKEFDQPEYYIGQQVLHRIRVRGGEILHPVEVIGLHWTGVDWSYGVLFPEDHPEFEDEDNEWAWVDWHQLEAM
jgi:hypothetical protein